MKSEKIVIKFVRKANMWVKSTFTREEKTWKLLQKQEWFETKPQVSTH